MIDYMKAAKSALDQARLNRVVFNGLVETEVTHLLEHGANYLLIQGRYYIRNKQLSPSTRTVRLKVDDHGMRITEIRDQVITPDVRDLDDDIEKSLAFLSQAAVNAQRILTPSRRMQNRKIGFYDAHSNTEYLFVLAKIHNTPYDKSFETLVRHWDLALRVSGVGENYHAIAHPPAVKKP